MHYAANCPKIIFGLFFQMVAILCNMGQSLREASDFIGESPVIGMKTIAGAESSHFFRHLPSCKSTSVKPSRSKAKEAEMKN